MMLPLASYVSAATYQPTSGEYHWTKYPASISRTYAPPPASVMVAFIETLYTPPTSVASSSRKIVSRIFPGLLEPW